MQANNIFSIESQELGEEVVVHNFFDIKIMSAYNKVSLDIQDALKNTISLEFMKIILTIRLFRMVQNRFG